MLGVSLSVDKLLHGEVRGVETGDEETLLQTRVLDDPTVQRRSTVEEDQHDESERERLADTHEQIA